MKKCGICGSEKDLVGPFIGGPFAWYCETCKEIVDKYVKGHEDHQEIFESIRLKQIKEHLEKFPDLQKIKEQNKPENQTRRFIIISNKQEHGLYLWMIYIKKTWNWKKELSKIIGEKK